MRVAITGSSGYIGREVVRLLEGSGADVVALGRSDDIGTWTARCATIDALIHLAAPTSGVESTVADDVERFTRTVFAALPDVPLRIVFAGSMALVAAPRASDIVDERSPLWSGTELQEADAYTIMKSRQENLVRDLCAARPCTLTIVRPTNVWDTTHCWLPAVGPKFGPLWFVIGPSRRLRVVHLANCARAMTAALTLAGGGLHVMNIDDGADVTAWRFATLTIDPTSRRYWPIPVPVWLFEGAASVAAYLLRIVGRRRLPGLLVARRRTARFAIYRVDTTLARRALPWSPDLEPYRGV